MPRKRNSLPRVFERRLRQARVARFATLDPQGRPHLVPICFARQGKVFYTAIDGKPKRAPPERLARLRNIRVSPRVALLVDEYAEDWTQLWYVLIRGKASLVPSSDRSERALALRRLKAKYPQYARGMLPADAPIIRITAERITTWSMR
jgi:PPOX class probable F420-dependent enzyme